MSKQRYSENAARCLDLADQASDAIRMGLLDMAHVWLTLAEQSVERDSRGDLDYETSPS